MPRRYTKGATVAQPQHFEAFASKQGGIGVRIANQRTYDSADEVFLSAPAVITCRPDGLYFRGEGVVRRRGRTISITS